MLVVLIPCINEVFDIQKDFFCFIVQQKLRMQELYSSANSVKKYGIQKLLPPETNQICLNKNNSN